MAIRKPTMLLTAVLLFLGAAAQDQSNLPIFYYPPDGASDLIFNKMDTVMVTYQAFYDTVDLYTFCEPGVGKLIYQQKAPGFNATVPILLNFTSATPCWYNVRQGPKGEGTNSAVFSLIGAERSSGPKVWGLTELSFGSTTSSSTSSTATASSSKTTGGPSAASTTFTDSGSRNNGGSNASTADPIPGDTASASSGSGGSSGISTGASAGIGVGAGLGVLALGGLVFFIWRRRQGRRVGQAAAEMDGNNHTYRPEGYGGYGGNGSPETAQYYGGSAMAAQKWQYTVEMNATSPAVEIASSGSVAGQTGRMHHELTA